MHVMLDESGASRQTKMLRYVALLDGNDNQTNLLHQLSLASGSLGLWYKQG
jgi:hypothetical protein